MLILPVLVYAHSFIDTNTIADLPNYKESFYDASTINVFNPVDIEYFRMFHKCEYGYILLLKSISLFTADFGVYLCVSSCLFLGFYSYVILKYSPNVGLSFLMLLLIVFDQSTFVLRQHFSIAFVLLSIPSILERKFYKFLLIVAIATLLHKSTFIWFIMYFFYGMKKPWQIFLSLGTMAVVIGLIFNNLGFLNDRLGLGYASYIEGAKTGESNLVSFFVSLTMFVAYMVVCGKRMFDDGIMKLCTLAMYTHIVLSFVGVNLSLLSRFSLVFNTSVLFIVPIVCKNIKSGVIRFAYIFMCLTIYGYITHFGSFSESMKECKLYLFNTEEMIYFLILIVLTLYVTIKSQPKKELIKLNNA